MATTTYNAYPTSGMARSLTTARRTDTEYTNYRSYNGDNDL